MSKNTKSATSESKQTKIARFLVISSTTVLGAIFAITGDSSLVPFIVAGVVTLTLPTAVKIFLAILAERKRRKIEAKNLQEKMEDDRIKREEDKAAVDQEFNKGKAQGKKVATAKLSGRQEEKDTQGQTRRAR